MAEESDEALQVGDFRWHKKEGAKWKGPKSESKVEGGEANPSWSPGLQLFDLAGNAGTTQEGKDDQNYEVARRVEGKGELAKIEWQPERGKYAFKPIDIEFIAQGYMQRFDLLEELGLKPVQGTYEVTTFVSPGPFAVRTGDPTVHGEPLSAGMGSPDVLIGGRPAWRAALDFHRCSLMTAGVPHIGGVVTQGEPTVLINGMPAVRAGDFVLEPAGGPNPVATGEMTVQIGPLPPPVNCAVPTPPEEPSGIAKYLDIDVEGAMLHSKSTGYAGASVDLQENKGMLGGEVGLLGSVLRGNINTSLKIPVSDSYTFVLGLEGEGSLLTGGAEVGGGLWAGEKDAQGKRRYGFDKVRGKVGAGLLGGGLGFSAGVEVDDSNES